MDKFQKIMHPDRLRCANINKGQKMNAEKCNVLLYADSVIHIFCNLALYSILKDNFKSTFLPHYFSLCSENLEKKCFQ